MPRMGFETTITVFEGVKLLYFVPQAPLPLVSCLSYSSTLNMKATYSSETTLTFIGIRDVISRKIS
jgi:hypothetical protein